jgi:hypothetical protein
MQVSNLNLPAESPLETLRYILHDEMYATCKNLIEMHGANPGEVLSKIHGHFVRSRRDQSYTISDEQFHEDFMKHFTQKQILNPQSSSMSRVRDSTGLSPPRGERSQINNVSRPKGLSPDRRGGRNQIPSPEKDLAQEEKAISILEEKREKQCKIIQEKKRLQKLEQEIRKEILEEEERKQIKERLKKEMKFDTDIEYFSAQILAKLEQVDEKIESQNQLAK